MKHDPIVHLVGLGVRTGLCIAARIADLRGAGDLARLLRRVAVHCDEAIAIDMVRTAPSALTDDAAEAAFERITARVLRVVDEASRKQS